jgi:hypothetical protein
MKHRFLFPRKNPEITREPVTFHVPSSIEDIPAGKHTGYVEHLTTSLHGHSRKQIARVMLHIERGKHPECFSARNSVIEMDIDVTKHIIKGTISYGI